MTVPEQTSHSTARVLKGLGTDLHVGLKANALSNWARALVNFALFVLLLVALIHFWGAC